jgi:hypothetical protein
MGSGKSEEWSAKSHNGGSHARSGDSGGDGRSSRSLHRSGSSYLYERASRASKAARTSMGSALMAMRAVARLRILRALRRHHKRKQLRTAGDDAPRAAAQPTTPLSPSAPRVAPHSGAAPASPQRVKAEPKYMNWRGRQPAHAKPPPAERSPTRAAAVTTVVTMGDPGDLSTVGGAGLRVGPPMGCRSAVPATAMHATNVPPGAWRPDVGGPKTANATARARPVQPNTTPRQQTFCNGKPSSTCGR